MTSSLTAVYKWQIYCVTEAGFQTIWTESNTVAPTTCPNDTAHTVNASSQSVIASSLPNAVKIIEEEPPVSNNPTGGYYRLFTKAFDCPAGDTTTDTFSFAYPVTILSGIIQTESSMEGDLLKIEGAKGTTIGGITSAVAASDTVIHVSPTVLANVVVGRYLSITDGSNTTAYSEIVGIDRNADTVTLADGSAFAFTAGSLVKLNIKFCDVELGPPGQYEIGRGKIGGSYIPIGVPITISYTNNGADTQRPRFFIQILY